MESSDFVGELCILPPTVAAMPPSAVPTAARKPPTPSSAARPPVSLTSRQWSCSELQAGQSALRRTKLEQGCHDDRTAVKDLNKKRLEARMNAYLCKQASCMFVYAYIYIHMSLFFHAFIYACIGVCICTCIQIDMYKPRVHDLGTTLI